LKLNFTGGVQRARRRQNFIGALNWIDLDVRAKFPQFFERVFERESWRPVFEAALKQQGLDYFLEAR
jgi:hypothetical protein